MKTVDLDLDSLRVARWLFFAAVIVFFVAIVLETLRNIWLNWGWSHPFMSSVIVGCCAVALWWIFGGIVWASAPRPTDATAEVHGNAKKRLAFSDMNNAQLRDATATFVARLRKFNSDYRRTADALSMKEWSDFQAIIQKIPEAERKAPERQQRITEIQGEVMARKMTRYGQFEDSFKANYLIDAQLLDKELEKRVNIKALITDPGSGPYIAKGRPSWALEGKLAGPDPLGDLANYLESLGKQLPDDE